ncbi:MAG: MarR family winged helix-turn-helix transcriptional regulator [Tagaea sp.]|nr:winged helix DNA-binding protein [Azospirillum sp.]MCA3266657.1 winged helix DNA-binding protein [Azospirillum sp.]MCZ8124858.1 winged helix DNA-binding protein [Magnetospirillum sp.]
MSNLKRDYLDSVSLVERLHRQFLEVVKLELDRMSVRDINNVQALILYNIGKDELTVGELTQRGYYLGSNVSYNLKKLIDNDYISQARSPHDRRSVRVKLTAQGLKLHERLDQVFARHADELTASLVKPQDLTQLEQTLRRMEQFWIGAIGQGGYAPLVTTAAE